MIIKVGEDGVDNIRWSATSESFTSIVDSLILYKGMNLSIDQRFEYVYFRTSSGEYLLTFNTNKDVEKFLKKINDFFTGTREDKLNRILNED